MELLCNLKVISCDASSLGIRKDLNIIKNREVPLFKESKTWKPFNLYLTRLNENIKSGYILYNNEVFKIIKNNHDSFIHMNGDFLNIKYIDKITEIISSNDRSICKYRLPDFFIKSLIEHYNENKNFFKNVLVEYNHSEVPAPILSNNFLKIRKQPNIIKH